MAEDLEKARQKIAEQENCIIELQQKSKRRLEAKSNATLRELRRIIETHIYPEIANELLRRAGLIDFSGNRVLPDSVADETVDVQTDVNAKIDSISEKLMKGFDD